jgi:hypothetical protein
MGSFTDYGANILLDHFFGGVAGTPPATIYARLTTTTPSRSVAGTQVSTGTWTNYAPLAITNNTTNFPSASAGAKSNGTLLDFGTADTTGDVDVAGIEFWTASSGGSRFAWSAVVKTVQDNDPVTIEIGALDITI